MRLLIPFFINKPPNAKQTAKCLFMMFAKRNIINTIMMLRPGFQLFTRKHDIMTFISSKKTYSNSQR